MTNKRKFLNLLFFVSLFLFQSGGFLHAFEASYPKMPGLPLPSADCIGPSCLPILAAYWFGILVYGAGLISVVSLAIAGITFIASAGNSQTKKDASDRIKGSLLGLGLVLISFLIIRTINESLITPAIIELPAVDGVYYTNGTEDKPCPVENSNIPLSVEKNFRTIKYACSTGPALLIWEFPEANTESGNPDLSKIRVARKNCGETEDIGDYGSFRISFETPGVYFCSDNCNGNMCSNYMSSPVSANQENISDILGGNEIKAVRIVNEPSTSYYYGVIFHKERGVNNAGDCSYPIINEEDNSVCKNISLNPKSVNVFLLNKFNSKARPSGTGIGFYSEPYGDSAGAESGGEGSCEVTNTKIGKILSIYGISLAFDNIDYQCGYAAKTAQQYKNIYKSFKSNPGSIKINGSYLVSLYADTGDNGGYCQVFSRSVPNLKVQSFVATGYPVERIYIIPIK